MTSNETRRHRKIVLRVDSSVLDTGFTTASDSEVSTDDRLKRQLCPTFERDVEIPSKKVKPNEVREHVVHAGFDDVFYEAFNVHRAEVITETTVAQMDNDYTPVSPVEKNANVIGEITDKEIEQPLIEQPIIDLNASIDSEDVIKPGQDKDTQTALIDETQSGPQKVYDLFEEPEEEEEEPETEVKRIKDQKKIDQGKRLSEYLKNYRASGGVVKKRRTKSQRSGLILPVARILKKLKVKLPKLKIATKTAIMVTGVLEYIIAELIDISGNVTIELGRKRISPRHIFLAIKYDQDFNKLFENVNIRSGGVLPTVQAEPVTEIKRALKSSVAETSFETSSDSEPNQPKKHKAGYERAEEMKKSHDSHRKESEPVKNTNKTIGHKKKNQARVQQGKRLAELMKQRRAMGKENIQPSTSIDETTPQPIDKENVSPTKVAKIKNVLQVNDSIISSDNEKSYQVSSTNTTTESNLTSTTTESQSTQGSKKPLEECYVSTRTSTPFKSIGNNSFS